MEKVFTKSIRNVALLGHSGGGKTSLAESMLYISRLTDRLGTTADGNTVCDYDPEEIKRGYSVSAAMAPMLWSVQPSALGQHLSLIFRKQASELLGKFVKNLTEKATDAWAPTPDQQTCHF